MANSPKMLTKSYKGNSGQFSPNVYKVLQGIVAISNVCHKEKVHEKKSKKKLTSVSFAFTHTYTLEKLTLLLFSPHVMRQHQSIAV